VGAASLPTIETCGLPVSFFQQGKADDILSALGLDGQQLAEKALALLTANAG
jgi:deoxyxylulose-5-phosphate synthase